MTAAPSSTESKPRHTWIHLKCALLQPGHAHSDSVAFAPAPAPYSSAPYSDRSYQAGDFYHNATNVTGSSPGATRGSPSPPRVIGQSSPLCNVRPSSSGRQMSPGRQHSPMHAEYAAGAPVGREVMAHLYNNDQAALSHWPLAKAPPPLKDPRTPTEMRNLATEMRTGQAPNVVRDIRSEAYDLLNSHLGSASSIPQDQGQFFRSPRE